jgi:hypothetical protein
MSSTYTRNVLNHPYSGRSRCATNVTATTVFDAGTNSSKEHLYFKLPHKKQTQKIRICNINPVYDKRIHVPYKNLVLPCLSRKTIITQNPTLQNQIK